MASSSKIFAGVEGVQLVGSPERRQISFSIDFQPESVSKLLVVLAQHEFEFAIYDPTYPSPSDPGAYFSYSPKQGRWRMTLGNHGWSGGIYDVPVKAIASQLRNLLTRSLLTAIDLDHVHFSKHYAPETPEKNRVMTERLLALHAHN